MPATTDEAPAVPHDKEHTPKHVTMEEPSEARGDKAGDGRPEKEENARPGTPGHHVDLPSVEPSPHISGQPSPALRSSRGWDGKLRLPKVQVANPEALSDPDYSDEDNVAPGDEVPADEDLLDSEPLDTDEIACTQSRIRSIPALRLERFKQVTRLCLRQNLIEDVAGLAGVAATLQDLDLYDNLISHIRGLDDLVHLTSLDLSFNKIRHIKHISHLRGLTDLFFVANKISRIEGLDTLDKLRSLELGSNRIRELQNLDALVSLEQLWVAKNKITELKGLGGLPKLRLLSIQSNRIRDLAPLADAPQLEELYISHNALESLSGIERSVRLRVLDISNNRIASLAGLTPLADLEELWASYNQFSDFDELERELADKRALNTVYLEGNPLQLRAPALYRNKVRLALPQLKQIDATYVRAS